ncbi:MAG: UDP-N-acetylmuramoyl-L-alanyl-D-glutamate--2,6-diaminopimelate ligase [Porphyromonas sp.]|nr:UDP-N-acetylmuramoyl-L-alanyl-D-glutamate--2,6-diaminopimelate ligase [Porphyromonas sp.]
MELNKIMMGISHELVAGDPDLEILQITSDSRAVEQGMLFIALRGTVTDGHDFIPMAIEKGAAAILCEEVPEERVEGVAYLRVEHTDVVIGEVAANFYDHPSRQLKLVGVTGTNGKTTIATLLYHLFSALGHKSGLISTVCVIIDGEKIPSRLTTPDALTLQKDLREMVDAGCEYAFMEVSSHAVHQHRIGGAYFRGGIFTNLTRDHLDYHGTFLNYLHAKQGFFDSLPKEAFALTNFDETNGMVMVQNSKAEVHTYALKRDADFKGKILEQHLDGTDLIINGRELYSRLVGTFNAYNLLAICGAAILLGQPEEEVLRIASTLRSVDGRFQTVTSPKGYVAIIDYAHTPDALENVLGTIKELQKNHGGRIITVVGAGGNRDAGKRPIMAAVSAKLSEIVILTSDNPRKEDPDKIIDDMMEGLDEDMSRRTLRIANRRDAIRTACTMALPGDVILIAGKGHETYQEINGVRHHFSDLEEVMKITESEKGGSRN